MPTYPPFWFRLLLTLLPFASSRLAQAQDFPPPLMLRNGLNGCVAPGNHVAFLNDETARLSLDDIRKLRSRFQAGQLASGLKSTAVWCVFQIQNDSQQEWYLEIDPHYIPEIDFYQQKPDGSFALQQLGARHSYRQRPLPTNQLIVPLNVPPGTSRLYYVRFWSDNTLRFQLNFATLPVLYAFNQRLDLVNGLYFGLLLALMLYNGFVFVTLRDRTYLYYVLCIHSVGLNIAHQRGYAFQFLWPDAPFWNSANLLAAWGCLWVILFTNAFLNTRKYIPRLRWLAVFIVVPALLTLILTVFGYHSAGFRVQLFTSMMLTAYVFIIGVAVYREGFKPARFYLLGFGSLVIGVFFFILNDSTGSAMQFGSVIEAIILSYALVNKLNTYKLEKEQLQVQALEQASSFSQQLIQTQESERKRIAAELHDSVGQSLGLVKNKLLLLQYTADQVTPNKLEEVTQTVAQTIQEVRTISYGLRPIQLDLLGLTEAIKSLVNETAEASQIHFYEDVDNIDKLFSKESEINLYRIVQEGLNNLIKHAEATQAIVQIKKVDGNLTLWIEDDGRGIDASALPSKSPGLGLAGIRERLHLLKGSLEIRKAHPKGTILSMTIPTLP
jgi:signal transduction histidine kinase